MFRQQSTMPKIGSLTCPKCNSTLFTYQGNSVTCKNCGFRLNGSKANKYGAKRTLAKDGVKRDSKFEAGIADELLLRKQGKDIKDYDSQFKVEMWIYRSDGTKAFKVTHKVDFRIHHRDGSFELLEAKGVETSDYVWRRRLLEELWLPEHPDHIYTVVHQGRNR